MTDLDRLESDSIYIIREAAAQFKRIGLMWSIGKDSTTLLWLCRKAFLGRVPLPVLHIDTSYKFPEIYAFRDRYAREWGLDLRIAKNAAALQAGMNKSNGVLNCCGALKTEGLKIALQQNQLEGVMLGIRRDEHGVRAKERYFSLRDEQFRWDFGSQPAEIWNLYRSGLAPGEHVRVHPLLHWSERDVWRYIVREKIPAVSLYFSQSGRRYRSIGCAPCCASIESNASTAEEVLLELERINTSERFGRAQDKESAEVMQKLRSLGYM